MLHKRKRIVFDSVKKRAIRDYSGEPSTFTTSSNAKVSAADNMLHSKSTYFYRWQTILPTCCSVALLFVTGITLNPISNANQAHAETITANPTGYSSISMTISNGTSGELSSGDTVTTNVKPGLVNYIDNNIKISTSKIDRFYVTVQAAENGTSELTGTAHGETIAPVGKDITVDNFGDNTWGYALGEATTSSSSFAYNSLPAYNTAITPQYSSAQNLQDGEYNLKLTFAAKINADKPSDHYTTKAMVSVAADAKSITLLDINKMSELTSDICTNTITPAAFLANGTTVNTDVPTKQLVDDREGDNGTKYWVAKLADGNCWMTQNMAYSGVGNQNTTKKDTILAPNDITNPTSYTEVSIGDRTLSNDPNMATAYMDTTYNGHYLMGNYYAFADAEVACNGNGSQTGETWHWVIPTSNSTTANGSFGKLTTAYSIGNNSAGSLTMRKAPFYFIYAGYNASSSIGSQGLYWSSTPYGNNDGYALHLSSSLANPSGYNNGSSFGYSVRCLVSGS